MGTSTFRFSDDPGNTAFYCGLDVHKYVLAVAIYAHDDSKHEFIKSETFGTDERGLNMFWGFVESYCPISFTMEATNVYHHVVATFLDDKKKSAGWTFTVLIVNPADASGIPGRQKHDRLDATLLAKYTAAGLLKSGKPIVVSLEDIRALFRAAYYLEHDRTALKNRIKKTMDRGGFRPRGFNLNNQWCRDLVFNLSAHEGAIKTFLELANAKEHPMYKYCSFIKKHQEMFEPYSNVILSPGQRALMRQDIVELEFKTARKALLAIEIDGLIASRPGLRQLIHVLASIPGFTPYSAAWLLSEVGHCSKYADAANFLSYCGCCRKTARSANADHPTHVNRHSNKYAREMFFNAAKVVCTIMKRDSALKRYASRIMAKKATRSPKLAFCVVAAKIARITYAIMQSGKEFDSKTSIPNKKVAPEPSSIFTVADRKLLKKARICMQRIGEMKDLKAIARNAAYFADALDRVLREN